MVGRSTYLLHPCFHTHSARGASVHMFALVQKVSHVPKLRQRRNASFDGHRRPCRLVRIFPRSHDDAPVGSQVWRVLGPWLGDGFVMKLMVLDFFVAVLPPAHRPLLLQQPTALAPGRTFAVAQARQTLQPATNRSEDSSPHRHALPVTLQWLQSNYLACRVIGRICRQNSSPRSLSILPRSPNRRRPRSSARDSNIQEHRN